MIRQSLKEPYKGGNMKHKIRWWNVVATIISLVTGFIAFIIIDSIDCWVYLKIIIPIGFTIALTVALNAIVNTTNK
jgi:hypothetical protein